MRVERGGGVRKKCQKRKCLSMQVFSFFFEGGNEKMCVSKK
jgi:hypothetical protein